MNPQEFLAKRIEALSKPEGYETFLFGRAHPVLGVVDGISKVTGGPGLKKGFEQGVVQEKDPRSGQYDIVLPPMPF